MKLIIGPTVGYMLKVLKSKKKITAYKDEFDAIRHGDYKSFLSLVGGKVPFIVIYNNGKIHSEENNPNYECDFEGLLKSGNSLRVFYQNCLKEYGIITDYEIPDEVYEKVVTFEIAIRMHANNNKLLSKEKRMDLDEVINLLCNFKSLSGSEKEGVYQARRFVNMIKHFKHQFPSWSEGINHFLAGYSVLEKYKILIV
jgi:hypothetical protein